MISLAGHAMVVPPSTVTEPIQTLLGYFLWLVTAVLVGAGIWAGVEFAAAFRTGEPLDRAGQRYLLVAVCAIVTASASAWAGVLLI
ncbi:hypothetical protein [Nocardia brasiliensis]|uniref:hypothetical protein n=1 Tax=Nocardia brasiliensis TaxID=37326 RepID=UPI003D94AE2A